MSSIPHLTFDRKPKQTKIPFIPILGSIEKKFRHSHNAEMGVLSYAFGGLGFILIGAHEALLHSSSFQTKKTKTLFSISLLLFSSFFILNSALSLFDAHNSNDAVGAALQLQVLPIAFIFLFYSLLPLLSLSFTLPSPLLTLVGAFAFAEEFLLFYLQRKDPSGVENRYYDLLLVPIAVCVFCTVLELGSPNSGGVARLGRSVGLVLQGTWLIQIGLSLFSGWVSQGCNLHLVSRGNYTLRCKGHPEYHRARAIATLQFNCHLALLVGLLVVGFSIVTARNGGGGGGVFLDNVNVSTRYTPLGGAELQRLEHSPNFTLDSDDEDDETREEDNVVNNKVVVVEHVAMVMA